jgi:protein-disulfide isomerase
MSGRPVLFVSLLGLAALGATCKGSDKTPAAPPPAVPPPPAAEAPLVKAPAITEMEGIELAEIPPAQRSDALRLLNENYCYCGCARTIAACLANRADCTCVKCSERMARFVLNQYNEGASTEDVEEQLIQGFTSGFNAKVSEFPLEEQGTRGPAGAPITLVEFADFRCPHCAEAGEVLDALLKQRNDVRLVYFYYPLSGGGETSVKAAEAAEEARVQGKFWELSHLLFANQHALEDGDLVRYAQEAGLNVGKFVMAMDKRVHRDKVMANKRLGEAVGVMSTPSIYVNGRPFGLGRTLENFNLRIDMEAERGRCD